MGRKKGNPILPSVMALKMTLDLHKRVKRAAKKQKMTLSEYVRGVLEKATA
jgi:predicted HicB family RNase H-like nuclease